MKTILSFIKTTLTGGVLFLLPFVLIIILLKEVLGFLFIISSPISKYLPDIIFGLNGSNIIAIFLLLFICFFSGLLFRTKMVKKLIELSKDTAIYGVSTSIGRFLAFRLFPIYTNVFTLHLY